MELKLEKMQLKDIAKVARSVTMIEPGLAVFDGEKWKISQKAIIEFNK